MDQNLKEKADQNPSRERTRVKKKSKMLNTKTISQISNLDGNQNVVISDQQPIIVKKE